MQPHQDPLHDAQKRVPGRNGGTLVPFAAGNPGGSAPKGKRISTWMAEFGEVPPEKWPSVKKKNLPANARIALVRLRKALDADKLGLANAEYVEPRVRRPEDEEPLTVPMLSQIAQAILALKAAGVEIRKPEPIEIEVEVVNPATGAFNPGGQPDDDEEEDDEHRTKRFRMGRQ